MTVDFDTTKTLEQLEKSCWGDPTNSSNLVRTCHRLRQKPINDFETEDLRIMIGQNIGLTFLIPIAISALRQNILAEGDMYEGDLLTNVLRSDQEHWTKNKLEWNLMVDLINREKSKLEGVDTVNSVKKEWFELIEKFKTYH